MLGCVQIAGMLRENTVMHKTVQNTVQYLITDIVQQVTVSVYQITAAHC